MALAFATPTFASAQSCPNETYAPWCNDGDPINGYWWHGDFWVPGLPSLDSWFDPTPAHVVGSAVFYSPWLMRATANYRGLSLDGYVDGVSGMVCGDIGMDVWLRRPGLDWEGPFLNVDCAQRNDLYGTTVVRGEAVEVSFDTALKWGMVERTDDGWRTLQWKITDVEVSKLPPEFLSGSPVLLSDWWLERLHTISYTEHGIELRNGWTQPWFSAEKGWFLRREFSTFEAPILPTQIPTLPTTTSPIPPTEQVLLKTPTISAPILKAEAATPIVQAPITDPETDPRKEVRFPNLALTVVIVISALLGIVTVTIRDWNRLGEKSESS